MTYNLYDTRICEAWKQVIKGEQQGALRHWQRTELLKTQSQRGPGSMKAFMQQEYPETKQWAGHNTYDEMKLRVSSAGPRPVSKASSKPSTSYVRTMEQRLNELQREVSQVKQDNVRLEREVHNLSRGNTPNGTARRR